MKTIVVVDQNVDLSAENLSIISFEQYLADYPKIGEPKTRIINLCNTSQYLSRGYYCSLLAEARQHRVLPSVSTINELRSLSEELDKAAHRAQSLAAPAGCDSASLLVFFGWIDEPEHRKWARRVFERFPSPILKVEVSRVDSEIRTSVERIGIDQLNEAEKIQFLERLDLFTRDVWRSQALQKRHRWDLAILVNPDEASPPSDAEAIKRFVKAGEKLGIHAELVTPKMAGHINQYDALFIRETTAIDHHTYRMARSAERDGLVVIDDASSILRCCNKVFLHDAFSYNKILAPKTKVISQADTETLDMLESEFSYPAVLKLPEGAFSVGVYKVENREQLESKLKEILKNSALALVQEYLPTDFDWRIGVLNGRAIYACRYYMARNHWQIYNHSAKRFQSGGFDTLPTFETPKAVLDTAIRACKIIGNGLYGVDIKARDNKVYVIEVNDNPSIDHKVEDAYLGNELYMLIMQEFARRLELRGR